jgi:hypothetical protein
MVDIGITVRNAIRALQRPDTTMSADAKRSLEDMLRLIAQQNPTDQEIQDAIDAYLEPPRPVKFVVEFTAMVPNGDLSKADWLRKDLAMKLNTHMETGAPAAPTIDVLGELRAQDLELTRIRVTESMVVEDAR